MNSKFKKAFTVSAMCISIASGNAMATGIPVFDGANAANMLQSIVQLKQQLDQLKQTYGQLQQTYNSFNGGRGMGNLIDNLNARKYLPPEYQKIINGAMTNQAQAIKNANKLLTDSDIARLSPAAKTILERQRNQLAITQASGEEAYRQASARFDTLQTLVGTINSASDPKAVLDLQARISAEQTMLQNEKIKLDTLSQLNAQQQRLEEMQNREQTLKIISGKAPRF